MNPQTARLDVIATSPLVSASAGLGLLLLRGPRS